MSDKKNENFGCGMACALVPFIGIMGLMMCFLAGRDKADDSEYIITDKENYKVIYAPISDRADLHVMEFGPFNTDSLVYRNINVGDTILGRKSAMDELIVPVSEIYHGLRPSYMEYFSQDRQYSIYSINGKSLLDIKKAEANNIKIARRDSILRTMRQKQK
ncbi:hypothetical protein HDR61_04935 [bacterium]|nr:hypothetical protein [bacterium]